ADRGAGDDVPEPQEGGPGDSSSAGNEPDDGRVSATGDAPGAAPSRAATLPSECAEGSRPPDHDSEDTGATESSSGAPGEATLGYEQGLAVADTLPSDSASGDCAAEELGGANSATNACEDGVPVTSSQGSPESDELCATSTSVGVALEN